MSAPAQINTGTVEWKTLHMHRIIDQRTRDICLFREKRLIIDTEKYSVWERSVCVCRALCVLGKRDRYVHACACACSRWADVCAAELVSLPMRACACMHVCVLTVAHRVGEGGGGSVPSVTVTCFIVTHWRGGVGPKNTHTIRDILYGRCLNVFRDQRPSKKLPEKAAF